LDKVKKQRPAFTACQQQPGKLAAVLLPLLLWGQASEQQHTWSEAIRNRHA
jgi:hypothetical protein